MKFGPNLQLGKAFGIDILLHWSFFLLPLLVILLSVTQGDSWQVTGLWIVLMLVILASVLWHELGHALAARRLGIPIVDIMITPICGLARLAHAPDSPRDEVLVALAGPMANGILAVLFGLIVWSTGRDFATEPATFRGDLLLTLLWIQVALCVLNLLPIFPMDGGRVLRAVLAMRMNGSRATEIAARMGQVVSLVAAIVGLVYKFYPLTIIAIFLMLTAEQELRQHRLYPDE
ncbi:MAG: site-2 protease family protein [Pirellulaceae bacterium]